MSDNALDKLKFVIEGDVEGDLEKFEKVAEGLEKIKGALSGFKVPKGLENTMQALRGASDVGDGGNLGKLADALSKFGGIRISSTIPKRLGEISQAANGITEESVDRVSRLADALGRLAEVKGISGASIKNAMKGASELANTEDPTTEVQDAGSSEMTSDTKISKFKEIAGIFARLPSSIGSAAKSLKNFALNTKGISAAVHLGAVGVKTYTALLKNAFIKPIGTAIKKSGEFLSSIKRIAMYRAIRFMFSALSGAMREGIGNLYQYSKLMGGTFAGSMDSLASSFMYLKNSMGAMVSPLINAIAPAVDTLINKFVQLLNIVNMVFARLTGASTYTRAVKTAQEYAGAVGGAAGGAADAMDDLKKTILGFDELNVLNDNNKSSSGGGGGGGGGGSDFGGMFEEVPIESNVSDFVDRLKDAFARGDWEDLGHILGEKVNSIVDTVDWRGLGEKFGTKLDMWFQTSFHTLNTIDFNKIGSGLAETLNGVLESVDWWYVGAGLTQKVTVLGDLIIGAFETINWKSVGSAFTEFLRGSFDNLTAFFTRNDFVKLGQSVVDGICDFFKGGNFSLLATSIAEFIGSALGGLAGLLVGAVTSFATELWELITKIITDPNITIFSPIEWAQDCIIQPLIDGFKNGIGGDALNGLAETFRGLGQKFLDWIAEGVTDIGGWITDRFVNPIKRKINEAFGKEIFEISVEPKDESHHWWASVKEWWQGRTEGHNAGSFDTNVSNDSKTWWSNAKEWWQGRTGNAGNFSTNVRNESKTWWGNAKSWWQGRTGNAGNFQTNVKNESRTWWSNVKGWWKDKAGTLSTKISYTLPKITIKWTTSTLLGLTVPKPSFAFNAMGGIFRRASLMGFLGGTGQIAGESGREALLPLDQNTGWMDDIAARVGSNSGGDYAAVVGAIHETNNEQMRLLEEQNALLRDLLAKPTGITTNNIVSAMERQNRRYGTSVIPITT